MELTRKWKMSGNKVSTGVAFYWRITSNLIFREIELPFNAKHLEFVGRIEKTQALIHAIRFFDEMIALRDTIGKTFGVGGFPLMQHFFYMGGLRPKGQPLSLLYAILTDGESLSHTFRLLFIKLLRNI